MSPPMPPSADAGSARSEALKRLAESRAQIRQILEPAPRPPHAAASDLPPSDAPGSNAFPRSRTMRLLLSGRGLGTAGAVVGGLIMARPALALKLLRMLPAGAVARMLMLRAITAFKSKRA